MKKLEFEGTSLEDLKNFPPEARREAGHQLHLVQIGENPTDWKPMETIGAGVKEIRVHIAGEWRVLYVTKLPEAVYVLHVFSKKSKVTRKIDKDLAKRRYQDLINRLRK
jgi:phage-related protein